MSPLGGSPGTRAGPTASCSYTRYRIPVARTTGGGGGYESNPARLWLFKLRKGGGAMIVAQETSQFLFPRNIFLGNNFSESQIRSRILVATPASILLLKNTGKIFKICIIKNQ